MSNTNYDVELNISYDNAHRHYIPTYTVMAPWFENHVFAYGSYSYNYFVSLDAESEVEMGYTSGSITEWAYNCDPVYYSGGVKSGNSLIPYSGIYNKVYLRNPRKNQVNFNQRNCGVKVLYQAKAAFEIQWNAVGFAANNDAWFKCSTIPKNTYKQYEWTAATVYYKKTTDSTYSSAAGTVSGSWSDVTINTGIDLEDGYTYDVYIKATADDGTIATTPVAQFNTIDADAVAMCISPSGAFLTKDVTFVWAHSTAYGTPQYAYDLQYSNNNGGSWTTVANHKVTQNTTDFATLVDAGLYKWRVRTYNSNNVAGEWAEASFVNQVPANPPTNVQVTTKGRPTVSWTSVSQSAYQVQFLLGNTVVYDSGAVYTSEKSHFANQYFYDTRSYVVKVRIYNALGEVSDWVETGYQQPAVSDVEFTVNENSDGGVTIEIIPDDDFTKYFILRNDKLIAQVEGTLYTDNYAVGTTTYSVVGVTSEDQSDIQTQSLKLAYPCATLIAQNGQQFRINKRVDSAYEIETNNQTDINKAKFIGDGLPTHYPSNMRLKTFNISFFDEQGISESLLGTLVFYADNFGNGGWCMVTAYDKADNFIKNGQGIYANEVTLTLEVTNYDDSIEYPI